MKGGKKKGKVNLQKLKKNPDSFKENNREEIGHQDIKTQYMVERV